MALPQGANFRNTLGFVTDGANEDVVLKSDGTPYPTTSAQGNTWGWEQGVSDSGNENAGNDRRLAGFNQPSVVPANFRIDLPSTGNYDIRLAAGDANYVRNVDIELFDTSSSLGVLSSGSTSATQRFKDATNTEYTNVTWPGSNTAVTKTFTTTICRFRMLTSNGVVAHVNVAAAAVSGAISIFIAT